MGPLGPTGPMEPIALHFFYDMLMPLPQDAYADLIRRIRDAGILASCAGLLGWDERTYMPRAGAAHRGEQMALLARLGHEMVTDPRVGEALAKIEQSKPG